MTNEKLQEILAKQDKVRKANEAEFKERITDVMEAMGLSTEYVDFQAVAEAMEKMLALIDMQNDLLDAATDRLEEMADYNVQYAAQINDYCLEIEQDLHRAQEDIKALKAVKTCSCDIVSETMRNLQ